MTPTSLSCDVAVLGSGFAGSLSALILSRIGLRTVLIDKSSHPRFAIGESSTPIANMVLSDLAKRYDLPRLLPLAKYGTWQAAYPQLGCGLKRGFSYFQHERGRRFEPRRDHANELLVAASADDEHGDTHWLRADVDQFLVAEARMAGVPVWEQTVIESLEQTESGWRIAAQHFDGASRVEARFVIDATGEAGLVPTSLGFARDETALHTNSRALFAHFRGVSDWSAILDDLGGQTRDHPFSCDDAAQHHILDRAWVWMLRMKSIASVGIVFDERRHPLDTTLSPEQEWNRCLAEYPSLGELLRKAQLVDPPGRLLRTARLQRFWQRAAGENWAALPHTAGFIDPLHSSGIAQSLCGVERLAGILERDWNSPRLAKALREYERALTSEIKLIDQLVSGCFAGMGRFPRFVAFSMLYFAAATNYERRRAERINDPGAFLGADNVDFAQTVQAMHEQVGTNLDDDAFAAEVRRAIAPFNHVGLCDPAARNLYRYTVAPV